MSAVVQEIFKPSVHHAYLLTDSKGPYGLCVEPDERNVSVRPRDNVRQSVVLRPDCMADNRRLPTLFQFVPHGNHRWASGSESRLVDMLHDRMLVDRGIQQAEFPSPYKEKPDVKYWRLFYGLRCSATRVINSLLAELYATIPATLMRTVRRYPINFRSPIYYGLYRAGDRALQLADTFPYLALLIYDPDQETRIIAASARHLVERGALLREVAAAVDVPIAFRRFKPMVMRRALRINKFLRRHPYLVAHHCPDTVPRQRAWISAIENAIHDLDDDFGVWVASHFEQTGYWREVPAIVGDVADWVRATYVTKALNTISPSEVGRISTALLATGESRTATWLQSWWDELSKKSEGRPFDKRMASHTVLKLSSEWHERAAKAEAENFTFPEPCYDGDTIKGYCIVPIKAADELSRYGHQLHNCASQYSGAIAYGRCSIYVVSKSDGKPLAMAEIERTEKPKIIQLKGPCNRAVSKPIQSAVRMWLTRQQRKNGAGRMPARITNIGTPLADDVFDQEIPF